MLDLPPRANLSVQVIAEYLGISDAKVYEMVAAGSIPSKRIDRVIKIPRAEFLAWYRALPSASESDALNSDL